MLGNQDCLLMKRIAVVGTRRMSEYGLVMTQLFVKKLIEDDWCIVSGMARGIDSCAHNTCIEHTGKTVAVLGHGLSHCYPPENIGLKQKILDSGGILVSEYSQDELPTPEKFRKRDELMAKLSQVILVVECPRRSGAKITVSAAAELGKTVYVVPGPINLTSYHGSVEIIRNGGIPVYSPDDLIQCLHENNSWAR